MERFNIGPYLEVVLVPPGTDQLSVLKLRTLQVPPAEEMGPGTGFLYLSREESAHLAGVLIHCVLQSAAPASAVQAFRKMTIAELLDARAFPGTMPVEVTMTSVRLDASETKALQEILESEADPEEDPEAEPEGPTLSPLPPGV